MPEQNGENSLRDLFAAQGIVAVPAAILVLVLHIFSPDDCRALLAALHHAAQESPEIPELVHRLVSAVTAWFASGSSA